MDRQIAASVGASASLAPVLGKLMAGLPSLGSPTAWIVRMLSPWLSNSSRVLDIACGTGALAIALSQRTRCYALGIDGCAAFLDEARRRATGLPRLQFEIGDVGSDAAWRKRFGAGRIDVACMIGLWPLARAAPRLRQCVPPGGLYVVDDAMRTGRRFPDAPTMAEARASVASQGDRVICGRLVPRDVIRRQALQMTRQLEQHAIDIGSREPRLRRALIACIEGQREAGRLLQGPLRPALWIIQRGG